MNIIKWAKKAAKKSGRVAKGDANRKRIEKKLPDIAKGGGVASIIAKRRLAQKKILNATDKNNN